MKRFIEICIFIIVMLNFIGVAASLIGIILSIVFSWNFLIGIGFVILLFIFALIFKHFWNNIDVDSWLSMKSLIVESN